MIFKYIIINEDNIKREKHESQTEEVNIYYIKASNGNPPLKIVDLDLKIQEELHLIKKQKKLEETFKTQTDRIHTVCFVGKSSDDKFSAKNTFLVVFLTFLEKILEKI